MGYNMETIEARFNIAGSKKRAALHALKDMVRREEDLDWIRSKTVLSARTLEDTLAACRWRAEMENEEDEEGDIVDLWFEGENMGDDKKVLDAIAPHVSEGCYIVMQGEDAAWKWAFSDGRCTQHRAKGLQFEDEESEEVA